MRAKLTADYITHDEISDVGWPLMSETGYSSIPTHAWSKLVLVTFHPLSKVKKTFL
jgi:hypothetical protein